MLASNAVRGLSIRGLFGALAPDSIVIEYSMYAREGVTLIPSSCFKDDSDGLRDSAGSLVTSIFVVFVLTNGLSTTSKGPGWENFRS